MEITSARDDFGVRPSMETVEKVSGCFLLGPPGWSPVWMRKDSLRAGRHGFANHSTASKPPTLPSETFLTLPAPALLSERISATVR